MATLPRRAHPENAPSCSSALTLPIEPFVDELRYLSAELIAHLSVVRDRVVVQMPIQFQFGLLQEFSLLSATTLSLQPSFHLFQFRAVLLPGGLPFHFEVAVLVCPQ